jgi:hypothetical protein
MDTYVHTKKTYPTMYQNIQNNFAPPFPSKLCNLARSALWTFFIHPVQLVSSYYLFIPSMIGLWHWGIYRESHISENKWKRHTPLKASEMKTQKQVVECTDVRWTGTTGENHPPPLPRVILGWMIGWMEGWVIITDWLTRNSGSKQS